MSYAQLSFCIRDVHTDVHKVATWRTVRMSFTYVIQYTLLDLSCPANASTTP